MASSFSELRVTSLPVTLRRVRDRSDTGWSQAREPWQRLAWARQTAGFSTPTAFAREADIKPHTYAAYERAPGGDAKSIRFGFAQARALADRLDVRWEWLLNGQGLPWREDDLAERPPEAEEAADILSAEPDEAERRRMLEVLRLMKRTGTGG